MLCPVCQTGQDSPRDECGQCGSDLKIHKELNKIEAKFGSLNQKPISSEKTFAPKKEVKETISSYSTQKSATRNFGSFRTWTFSLAGILVFSGGLYLGVLTYNLVDVLVSQISWHQSYVSKVQGEQSETIKDLIKISDSAIAEISYEKRKNLTLEKELKSLKDLLEKQQDLIKDLERKQKLILKKLKTSEATIQKLGSHLKHEEKKEQIQKGR